jgi:hypothetical protein
VAASKSRDPVAFASDFRLGNLTTGAALSLSLSVHD